MEISMQTQTNTTLLLGLKDLRDETAWRQLDFIRGIASRRGDFFRLRIRFQKNEIIFLFRIVLYRPVRNTVNLLTL